MKNLKRTLALTTLALLLCSVLTACAKKQVSVNTTPKSIVCLSPASVEICFAIGAGNQVKAVSEYTDYPPEAKNLPVAGSFDGNGISLETVLSFEPDLVYLTAGMHDFLIEPLQNNNIAYYVSNATSIDAVKNEILDLGKLTGHEQEASSVVSKMDEVISQYKSSEKPISVYYEVWNSPYMSVGKNSFMNDMITAIGGKNICGEIEEGYPMISEETIIACEPEVILLPQSNGVSAESVANRPGWKDIPAVKNNRIYLIDDNTFSRPGPRLIESIKTVGDLLK